MNNHEETSRARAMRLLALVRERTEHAHEPVFITELAAACQLSTSEAEAAWRYLRDHDLVDTFSIPLTARINSRGIDALDSETDSRSGAGTLREGPGTARGYGRVDSQEALDRAREVSKELGRLHAFLPNLTNSELSAYSTKSLPIGTFLQSKGQTFSVLTEDMLANAFKEEADRRKTDTTADRWLRKFKNNPVVAAIVILAVAIGGAAALYENLDKLKPIVQTSSKPPPLTQKTNISERNWEFVAADNFALRPPDRVVGTNLNGVPVLETTHDKAIWDSRTTHLDYESEPGFFFAGNGHNGWIVPHKGLTVGTFPYQLQANTVYEVSADLLPKMAEGATEGVQMALGFFRSDGGAYLWSPDAMVQAVLLLHNDGSWSLNLNGKDATGSRIADFGLQRDNPPHIRLRWDTRNNMMSAAINDQWLVKDFDLNRMQVFFFLVNHVGFASEGAPSHDAMVGNFAVKKQASF